jgi:hypothetical protein
VTNPAATTNPATVTNPATANNPAATTNSATATNPAAMTSSSTTNPATTTSPATTTDPCYKVVPKLSNSEHDPNAFQRLLTRTKALLRIGKSDTPKILELVGKASILGAVTRQNDILVIYNGQQILRSYIVRHLTLVSRSWLFRERSRQAH